MSDYTEGPISFDQIREGDELEVTFNWLGLQQHRTGAAAVLSGTGSWLTTEGGSLVVRSLDPTIHRKPRPVPTYEPGVTGTATVRGVEGVRVMKRDEDGEWFSATRVAGFVHQDADVTDFTPDPKPLTAESVEELIEADGGLVVQLQKRPVQQPDGAYQDGFNSGIYEAIRIVREWAAGQGVRTGGAE